MDNILVSVSCITYNHEKYIADAIDSFLMQKTTFKIEILIHDDASTDNTAKIIREYEKKYPDLIKPIYQSENQYSKGVSVESINVERAKGKYIAICEGDDYWTDPYKLQKQVDYMENHPECSLCVHGGYVVSATEKKILMYNRPNKGNKLFTVSEVIEGGGSLFLTNSMLYPTEFRTNRPAFLENAPVGDYPLVINLSLLGTVYCIDEIMSAYRVGDECSWTAKYLSNIKKKEKHYNDMAIMLEEINHYTNKQYDDVIKRTKKRSQLFLLFEKGNYKEAKTGEFKELYLELGLKMKIALFMENYSPGILKILRIAKRKFV
ncbi:glycosyl transferase family 2 [Lysinibacillus xylanilyticus]|uniref:Glycosyl transferase family 2 n=1 Tax=Lysinibacillus xylanilyticus TaxID=582475 RepID=A0A0K9F692_9BACI|nr:glycosyltransferase [Lysinibacillus xylanilyticus]KMY29626.1 glycosyl transferase family 2 [Lysinibacillus xylanilyticus]